RKVRSHEHGCLELERSRGNRGPRGTGLLRTKEGKLAVGEVAQARLAWPPEVFSAACPHIGADQAGDRSVGIEDHRRVAAFQQEPTNRPGAANKLRDVAAINQAHARQRKTPLPDPERLEYEGI